MTITSTAACSTETERQPRNQGAASHRRLVPRLRALAEFPPRAGRARPRASASPPRFVHRLAIGGHHAVTSKHIRPPADRHRAAGVQYRLRHPIPSDYAGAMYHCRSTRRSFGASTGHSAVRQPRGADVVLDALASGYGFLTATTPPGLRSKHKRKLGAARKHWKKVSSIAFCDFP